MSDPRWRAGLTFLALGSLSPLLGQTATVYLSFFDDAALKAGETADLTQPSIENSIGITDREADSLVEVARRNVSTLLRHLEA